MAYTLDTAAAIERITAAGPTRFSRGAIVAEVARADESLVTQADLRAELAALEEHLLKWGIGIALAVAGLLFAALRLTGGAS